MTDHFCEWDDCAKPAPLRVRDRATGTMLWVCAHHYDFLETPASTLMMRLEEMEEL